MGGLSMRGQVLRQSTNECVKVDMARGAEKIMQRGAVRMGYTSKPLRGRQQRVSGFGNVTQTLHAVDMCAVCVFKYSRSQPEVHCICSAP